MRGDRLQNQIPSNAFFRFPPNNDISPPPWTLPSGTMKSKLLLPAPLLTPVAFAYIPPSVFSALKRLELDDDFIDRGTSTCWGMRCALSAGLCSNSMLVGATLTPDKELPFPNLLLLPAVEAPVTRP